MNEDALKRDKVFDYVKRAFQLNDFEPMGPTKMLQIMGSAGYRPTTQNPTSSLISLLNRHGEDYHIIKIDYGQYELAPYRDPVRCAAGVLANSEKSMRIGDVAGAAIEWFGWEPATDDPYIEMENALQQEGSKYDIKRNRGWYSRIRSDEDLSDDGVSFIDLDDLYSQDVLAIPILPLEEQKQIAGQMAELRGTIVSTLIKNRVGLQYLPQRKKKGQIFPPSGFISWQKIVNKYDHEEAEGICATVCEMTRSFYAQYSRNGRMTKKAGKLLSDLADIVADLPLKYGALDRIVEDLVQQCAALDGAMKKLPTPETDKQIASITRKVMQPSLEFTNTLETIVGDMGGYMQLRSTLASSYVRAVTSFVRKNLHLPIDKSDAISAGNVGLIHGIDGYDLSSGIQPLTYIWDWIKQGVYREISDTVNFIRIPAKVYDDITGMAEIEEAFRQSTGKDISINGLAERTGKRVSRIRFLKGVDALNSGVVSLTDEAPERLVELSGNGGRLHYDGGQDESLDWLDQIHVDAVREGEPETYEGNKKVTVSVGPTISDVIDDGSISIGDTVNHRLLNEGMDRVLNTLTFREREIIKMRYGIGTGYTYSLEEVGRNFKITRERVRQIEAKAIKKLQHPLRSMRLEEFVDERPIKKQKRRQFLWMV